MVNRKFNNFLGIVLLVLFGIGVLEFGYRSPTPLKYHKTVPSYRDCVGIDYGGEITYDWVISNYGEPDDIEIQEPNEKTAAYCISLTYGDLSFCFVTYSESELEKPNVWKASTIRTTDPEHYFGRKKIHVGSTREDVIKAYKKSTVVIDRPLGMEYYDGGWMDSVVFTYDGNDIVLSIEFVDDM